MSKWVTCRFALTEFQEGFWKIIVLTFLAAAGAGAIPEVSVKVTLLEGLRLTWKTFSLTDKFLFI